MRNCLLIFLAALLLVSVPLPASAVYYEDAPTEGGSIVYYEDSYSGAVGETQPEYTEYAGYWGQDSNTYYGETPKETINEEASAAMAGDAVAWNVNGSTLYITGQGDMYDFPNGAPWALFKGTISRVVISSGVTSVGAYAFHDFDGIISVDFGTTVTQVGAGAFYSCDGLTSVTLPASFKKFGADSFRSCRNLKELHMNGNFPRFDENCLWDTECTIYYPANNPWAVSLVEQLETAFHNRIEFRGSDGSDPYVPTVATEATVPVYIPETTAPTQPYVQPAETYPVQTQPATVPTTAPTLPPETQPDPTKETFLLSTQPTRPTEPEPNRGTDGKSIIGVLIILITLAMIATAALLFHVAGRSGGPKKRKKHRR